MTLDRKTINAIADAVAKKLRATEESTMDAQYLATLPLEELKRRQREAMRNDT